MTLMFEEPNEFNEQPTERAGDPANQAREKSDEFRMHAELAAVFEGCRKFDAELIPGLEMDQARGIQKSMMKLEKAKEADSPLVPPESAAMAADVLNFYKTHELSTNNYHMHRRPGELMIIRWLEGEEVQTFYERIQAHFDAAMEGFKEDERQAQGWKQDARSQAFLDALDGIKVRMEERYLREIIRKHGVFILSTQTADEINIAYLCDHIMGVSTVELVGRASAPPDEEPSERDLAWFFKLFSLRGIIEGVEQMCFFAYLQKSDDSF